MDNPQDTQREPAKGELAPGGGPEGPSALVDPAADLALARERDLDRELLSLASSARRIPFFALARHLSRVLPSPAPIGGLGPVAEEVIRFRHDVQPIFHAGDVTGLRVLRRNGKRVVEITTAFLGIVGSVSPLANYFTDDVLRADSLDETALRSFYDLFHHRLIAFVYGANLRAAPSWEVRGDGSDRVTRRSLALTASPRPADGAAGLGLLQWGGLARILGRRPRSRTALEAALLLAFPAMPIRVLDFLSRDVALPSRERAQLGVRNVTLGRGARLGSRLLRQTGLVRLAAGPLDRAAFDALLPGAPDHARLRAVLDSVTGGMLDADADLQIAFGEEPRARLGRAYGTRLGGAAVLTRPRTAGALRVRVPLTGDARAGGRLALAGPPV
jgi:type VI secretion system protein ImpH